MCLFSPVVSSDHVNMFSLTPLTSFQHCVFVPYQYVQNHSRASIFSLSDVADTGNQIGDDGVRAIRERLVNLITFEHY